jgi:hypothetical protein
VLFRLPFGPFGTVALPFVKGELRRIFEFRRGAIERALAEGSLGDSSART